MPTGRALIMIRRIYTDTSVIGGCLDKEFEEASQILMNAFTQGESTIVISSLTLLELQRAPPAVRAVLNQVPEVHREYIEMTGAARVLSNSYIEAGAIGPAHRADAQHIAVATVNQVEVLVSWNFRHIVNVRRIRAYNLVNERQGYLPLEIRTPREVIGYG